MQKYNALAEAKIIASVFAKTHAGFRVSPAQSFRETPAYTLFKLEMRRGEDINRLVKLRGNIEQALHAARYRAGVIDDLARTFVRVNPQPLQLEVNRPYPARLLYNPAKLGATPHAALCGLYYGIRQDSLVLWQPADPAQAHAWIAGTTGSGKTTLSVSMLASLCAATPPAELQIFINDFKDSESLRWLTKLPHVAGMATEPGAALQSIRDFHAEILRRIRYGSSGEPRCILYIDELASYTQHRDKAYRDETTGLLAECGRLGREYKMHMAICTQRPTGDVISRDIANNIPVRLVGMVTSPEESKYATGIAGVGAHLLPGRGAFVFVAGGNVTRFQVPLIENIAGEVRRIRALCGGAGVVQQAVHAPVQTGSKPQNADRTRVEQTINDEPVQVVQVFPLEEKRRLVPSEAAAVRAMADTMSKNALCIHVYGAKSGRYMGWIDEALTAQPQTATPTTTKEPFRFRGIVGALKPL